MFSGARRQSPLRTASSSPAALTMPGRGALTPVVSRAAEGWAAVVSRFPCLRGRGPPREEPRLACIPITAFRLSPASTLRAAPHAIDRHSYRNAYADSSSSWWPHPAPDRKHQPLSARRGWSSMALVDRRLSTPPAMTGEPLIIRRATVSRDGLPVRRRHGPDLRSPASAGAQVFALFPHR